MSRETLDTLRARLGISLNQVPAVHNAVPVIRHKTVQELVDLIHGHVNSTYQAREVLAENLETILLASLELERRIVAHDNRLEYEMCNIVRLTSYVGT